MGARLAIDAANAAGGIDGRGVRLIVKSGQTDPEALRAEVRAILRDYPATGAFLGLSDSD